jgi:apolipoprotein N-acyltransferase
MLLPVFSAFLGILAFFPSNFFYIFGFVFLAPIFIFIFREEKFWRLVLGLFIFKIILLTAAFYFAFEPYGFLLSIFVFLGLPIAVFFLKRGFIWFPSLSMVNSQWSLLVLLPFLWIFFENLQARYSFLPVYLGTIGNIFGNSPFLGLAAVAGLNSLSLFAISVNILIAVIVFNLIKKSSYKLNLVVIVIIIVIVAAGRQISQVKLQQNSAFYSSRPHTLRVGLVSNNEKFDEEFLLFKSDIFTDEEKKLASLIIDEKLNFLRVDLRDEKLDLLIFPEDMIDIEVWNDADKEAQEKFDITNAGILIGAYRNLAKELNTHLAATFTTIRNNKRYNTTLLFNKKGELVDIYSKSHLTIGGEYWPFDNWRPFYYDWLKKITPELDAENAIFNPAYQHTPGNKKLLKNENLSFASLICIEIHYPNEVKIFKNLGSQFISHTSSNRWITMGLKNYLYLTDNLRKIEAVWLRIPILINGRYEKAGIITPAGKINVIDFESPLKNYGLFTGEIKY